MKTVTKTNKQKLAVWLLRVCHAFKARNFTLLLFEIISFVEVSAHTHTLPSPFSGKKKKKRHPQTAETQAKQHFKESSSLLRGYFST